MSAWVSRHLQILFATLGAMLRAPLASANTILIIAVTLLLPVLLYIGLMSAQQLGSNWRGQPQISVFMQSNISPDEAQLIYSELRLHPAIELAEFISPQQALAEFRALSGLEYEIDFLPENPLPASIVIMPTVQYTQSSDLLSLTAELKRIDGIEDIRLDLDWTDRFNSIVSTGTGVAQLLSGLLALALLLIVGNTIRLLIMNRRHEIEITKLVGGSNAFVRRPFLYFGTLYGLFGALTCLILLLLVGRFLEPSLAQLASLYQQESLIYQPTTREVAYLLVLGSALGWSAARWSVARHLHRIKPK